jgi:hypothetical protein
MTGSAKQSISPRKERMDCFVARAPRNDGDSCALVGKFLSSGTTPSPTHLSSSSNDGGDLIMGRYLLLWMLGIPLPILVLIYAFGGLH